MPRGDGTGPAGAGPMTGRGLGYCTGYATPGYAAGPPRGGGGFGRGRGRGFGHRARVPAARPPKSPYWSQPQSSESAQGTPQRTATYGAPRNEEEELQMLREEAQTLQNRLEQINDRIDELED